MPDPSIITAYLAFGGNCGEAMRFYKKCLGGRLLLQTMEQSPLGKSMPGEMQKYILHAELRGKRFIIFGSDVPSGERVRGNNIMLAFKCAGKKQMCSLYGKLSGRKKAVPISFLKDKGMVEVRDRYGNYWLLYCEH